MENKRINYLDYLRIFATLSVIVIHIASRGWYSGDIYDIKWKVVNFYHTTGRWAVPVFLMISGVLFVDKKISIKKLYGKYVLRMVTSFLTWSTVYALYRQRTVFEVFRTIIYGEYHMWFVLLIIGIYICLPLIQTIAANDKLVKYYLSLWFMFALVVPQTLLLAENFGSERLMRYLQVVKNSIDEMSMHMVLGYVGFFLFGYYINKIEFDKKKRILIYLLGIASFFANLKTNLVVTFHNQVPYQEFITNFNVTVFFESLAIFVFFKNFKPFQHDNDFVRELSKYSYGAYLAHVLMIDVVIKLFKISVYSFNPLFSVPFISLLVFVLSMLLSTILHRIPIINKYIV